MAESRAHRVLKEVAGGWLKAQGFVAVGDEVHLPAGGFRVDVAGWSDRSLDSWGQPVRGRAQTAIIECKVSRSDLARDSQNAAPLLAHRAKLTRELRGYHAGPGRALRKACQDRPTLFDARGTVVGSVQRRIRRLRLELVAIDRRLKGRSKFAKMAWWRAADALWLAAPAGLVHRGDLPAGWGLLEWDGDQMLRVAVGAPDLEGAERDRRRMLRGIAVSGTRVRWAGKSQLALPIP